jgi:hypothetical protein
LDSSKLDEKGHKVVKSPTAIAGRDKLNSAQYGPTFAKGGHKQSDVYHGRERRFISP